MERSQSKEALKKRRQREQLTKDPVKHKLALEKDHTWKKLKRAEQAEKIESNPNQFKEKLEQERSLNREWVKRSCAKKKEESTPQVNGQLCRRQTDCQKRRCLEQQAERQLQESKKTYNRMRSHNYCRFTNAAYMGPWRTLTLQFEKRKQAKRKRSFWTPSWTTAAAATICSSQCRQQCSYTWTAAAAATTCSSLYKQLCSYTYGYWERMHVLVHGSSNWCQMVTLSSTFYRKFPGPHQSKENDTSIEPLNKILFCCKGSRFGKIRYIFDFSDEQKEQMKDFTLK